MAANNKILLNKFAQLFNSSNFLATTKGLLLATRMLGFLEPNGGINLPKEPARMLNAINQRFEVLLSDKRVTDNHLLTYLMTFNAQDIMAMGPDLVADVMESPAYKLFKPAQRQNFERQANEVFGFMNIDYKQVENWNNVVLNEESLRRMVDASSETQRAKTTAHGKIDNTLTAFDNVYRQADIVALSNGPKHYGNVFTPQANLMGKLRANYVSIWGEKDGNRIADTNEDLVNTQSTQGAKNAYLISVVAAHDETVMAIFKRRGIDAQKHNKAFLGAEIDGSDKDNQHFLPNLLKTFGGAGKTFGIAAGASFTVNLLSNIPVIGNFIGPGMAIATAVKKAHAEYKQASQIAAAQNRTLDRRDAARIAVNTAASVAPYAITMAAGPIGRYIGAGSMMVKTFFADINQQKTKLRNTEKLSATDYLASAGKAILNGAALWLGGKVGSTLGSTVADNFDGHGLENDLRAKLGLKPKLQTLQTENFKTGNTLNNDYDDEVTLTAPEDKLTTNNITADQNSLKTLQNHRFDLTDAARSTANPDTDRMYQLNHASGTYQQNDWYDAAEYQRAIDTLHAAGVQDADGALRNLAGARMFKGGEFKTELDNLLNGKLTTNTINKILEADNILDERADLIGGHTTNSGHTNDNTNLGPRRMTEYKLGAAAPETNAETDAAATTHQDPTFGPKRMTDFNIGSQAMGGEVDSAADSQTDYADNENANEEPSFGPDRMAGYRLNPETDLSQQTSDWAETENNESFNTHGEQATAAKGDGLTFNADAFAADQAKQDVTFALEHPDLLATESTTAATPVVETSTATADSAPMFDHGAAATSSNLTFAPDAFAADIANQDVSFAVKPFTDWRDDSYSSLLEHALDDIAEKYQDK